ncbi:hypothetical protein, partial [Campylobacter troglodytis]|uniref:hypothetical protein n=1 Tax=Campylobacter troglodytis TaxID=654363 RepID=UPI001C8E6AC7
MQEDDTLSPHALRSADSQKSPSLAEGDLGGGLDSKHCEESTLAKLENEFKQNGGKWEEFRIGDLFELFE